MRFGDDTLDSVANNALQAISPTMTVRTTITPPMTLSLAPDNSGAPPDPVMSFLMPSVTFNTAAGPLEIAPYGSPAGISPTVGIWGIWAGIAIAAFAGGFMWLGAKLAK